MESLLRGLTPEIKTHEVLFEKESGGEAILEIVAVVGDLVGDIRNLSLQGWAWVA